MADLEKKIFVSLFREACEKCFSRPLTEALKEPDAKRLSDEILEQTGLVIGWKSIKNFSVYATHPEVKREENPSVATLDTLARYVENAPPTDDLKRKATESHHPYWYNYKNKFVGVPDGKRQDLRLGRKTIYVAVGVLFVAITVIFFNSGIQFNRGIQSESTKRFVEDFESVDPDSLATRGWILKNRNVEHWNKRDALPGHLTLHTLIGDNWNQEKKPLLNLLTRRIETDCFSTEVHLTGFVPYQNWQQAGILLSEDSTFDGQVLRLSLAYNNFFGGFQRPSEIIIQVVGSSSPAALSKPEEIAHYALFEGDPRADSLIHKNLSRSALKIEKRGKHYRFLFTNGEMESFAFKEAAHREFDIQPRYVAIFAMQGMAASEKPIPAHFDSFNIIDINCD